MNNKKLDKLIQQNIDSGKLNVAVKDRCFVCGCKIKSRFSSLARYFRQGNTCNECFACSGFCNSMVPEKVEKYKKWCFKLELLKRKKLILKTIKMKLNKSQLDALSFFEENNYLIVEAARQTGKTTILKEIIKKNEDKKIGIMTLSYLLYVDGYKELGHKFKNIEHITSLEKGIVIEDFDIILGDEVFIEPFKFRNINPFLRTACALTPRSKEKGTYVIKNLFLPKKLVKNMERIKEVMSKDSFEMEYGRFLKK